MIALPLFSASDFLRHVFCSFQFGQFVPWEIPCSHLRQYQRVQREYQDVNLSIIIQRIEKEESEN